MSLDNHIKNKLHSAVFFDEQRDFWWNTDFLELMGKRLGLGEVRNVLDVGCGMGHWGRALSVVLPLNTNLTGIDRERTWIDEATERAKSAGLEGRFRYQEGLAEHLPFADSSFDLVTCQTVLIHVKEPKAVIAEMLRVTRPGGLLLVVEPNNLLQNLSFTDKDFARLAERVDFIDELLRSVRFDLLVQRGRMVLGEGFNSFGDIVPGFFAELGLDDIQTYTSDRAVPLFPPYSTPHQRALVKHYVDQADRQHVIWDKETSRTYFLAGGGKADEFDGLWNQSLRKLVEFADDLKHNAVHHGGGAILYLVSGRKPERQ
jgi:ubiquinone/menaquinone biosynthesis C-methylase UbiE